MSQQPEAPKPRIAILPYVFLAGMSLCAGIEVRAYLDQKATDQAVQTWTIDRQRERDAATRRETHLNELIAELRERHATEDGKRTIHWTAFTAHTARVRNELQTLLAASRAAHDGCQRTVAAVAETAGELDGLLGQSVDLLKQLRAENQRLAKETAEQHASAVAWEQRFRAEHIETVTVTATH